MTGRPRWRTGEGGRAAAVLYFASLEARDRGDESERLRLHRLYTLAWEAAMTRKPNWMGWKSYNYCLAVIDGRGDRWWRCG